MYGDQEGNHYNRMATLPCIWNKEEQQCMYLENQDVKNGLISKISSAYMNCEEITFQNGSQRACMNIIKQGQMCIYKDNKCTAFQQDETQNNCLDNININSCLQQKISDCIWNIEVQYNHNISFIVKVKKSFEENESDEYFGNCIKFDQYEQSGCDSRLSYTSCLKIMKEGKFCRWQHQKCQTIDDGELIIFQPSYFTEVNSNACGLINNGDIVKYDNNIKLCIKLDNVVSLSCLTVGLNKDACLNIKFQNCLWDISKRKCKEHSLNLNQNTCKLQNLSSYLCSQIKLDLPCGFIKDGCDFVDLNQVKCTSEGLNKYACLNIQQYPCIWLKNINDKNYHCEDYISYLPCNQIPSNVNPKVCFIIREGACYYNELNLKCEIPNKDLKSCELIGLNLIGCVQIENCFFDQKCQLLNKQNYKCNEFPIANKLICKNAIDSCKYNEFQYGCSPAQEEVCSNDSLSDQGCLSQPNCVLQAQGCKCRKFVETYDCTLIEELDKCKLQNHCIIQDQEKQLNQICKLKSCNDYSSDECEGKSILRSICYWSESKQCLSASKCEDIIKPLFKCSTYQFNDRPCQMNKISRICEQFNCENFSKGKCLEYLQFCKWEETCQKRKCSEFKMENCIINNCDWNLKKNTCQVQIDCSRIQEETKCNDQKYNSRPCQWVIQDDIQFCTQFRCRNPRISQQCSGSRIMSEVCVEISDSLCMSCEEISDSCDCLQQSQYCSYDIRKDKCTSKNCESYLTEQECPTRYCIYIQQKCQIQCEFIYNLDLCAQMSQCLWIEKYQICQMGCEYIKEKKLCRQMNQCLWIENDQKCQKECEYIQDEDFCKIQNICSWDKNKQRCQKQKINPVIIIQNDQKLIPGLIILCLILT